MAKTDVVKSTNDNLYIPQSFDEAISHFQETGEIVEFEGSPYQVVDKDSLEGVPFLIVGYRFNEGSFGQFVSVMAVTEGDKRVVFNDGSTGIMQQMRMVEHSGKRGGILCRNGLRRSDYSYTDEKGKEVPATTFYIG